MSGCPGEAGAHGPCEGVGAERGGGEGRPRQHLKGGHHVRQEKYPKVHFETYTETDMDKHQAWGEHPKMTAKERERKEWINIGQEGEEEKRI